MYPHIFRVEYTTLPPRPTLEILHYWDSIVTVPQFWNMLMCVVTVMYVVMAPANIYYNVHAYEHENKIGKKWNDPYLGVILVFVFLAFLAKY